MKAVKIKTKRTAPAIYYSNGCFIDHFVSSSAQLLAINTVGLIILKITNNTGFTDNDNKLFAHYDKKNNTVTVQTFTEMQQNGYALNGIN